MIQPPDIRKTIRTQRRNLSADIRHRDASDAARRLVSLRRFRSANRVALYLAADGELDPMPVLEQACAMSKQCYLPVLHPVGHRRLWFAAWKPGEPLRANSYGIPEPIWKPSSLVKPWALDLVIVPLVAFDDKGHRLGMGGGYYDRSFAWRSKRRHWRGPMLVGYGHELQKVRHVSVRPWDVPMDLIVTESALYMR